MNYLIEIESTVSGIPCLIGVTEFSSVQGSYNYNAASDIDYHGYIDCCWEVLDRRGRIAPWLERKLTSGDRVRIDHEIAEAMCEENY